MTAAYAIGAGACVTITRTPADPGITWTPADGRIAAMAGAVEIGAVYPGPRVMWAFTICRPAEPAQVGFEDTTAEAQAAVAGRLSDWMHRAGMAWLKEETQ